MSDEAPLDATEGSPDATEGWVATHAPQLGAIGLPEALWAPLARKLRDGVFDAGEHFTFVDHADAAAADDDDAVQRELSAALAELQETDTEGAAVGFEAQISVFCEDRRGMMMDVASVCTDVASNIVDVHSETRDGGGAACLTFTVQLHDAALLARLVGEMVGVPSVTRVVRSSMKELKRDRSTREFWALAEPGESTL